MNIFVHKKNVILKKVLVNFILALSLNLSYGFLDWRPGIDNLCSGKFDNNYYSLINDDELFLKADTLRVINKELTKLEGNIEARFNDVLLLTDSANIFTDIENETVKKITLNNDLKIYTNKILLEAKKAILIAPSLDGIMHDVLYRISIGDNNFASGQASDMKKDKNILSSNEATFTTCNPESPTWKIRAKNVTIDTKTNLVKTSHAFFMLKNITVFYAPFTEFSLGNERHSGFLFPEIGYANSTGLKFVLPYYFNLAKNQDLVVALGYSKNPGLILKGYHRLLLDNFSSRVDFNIVPLLFANKEYKDDLLTKFRGSIKLVSKFNFHGINFAINANLTSDKEYLQDFNNLYTGTVVNKTPLHIIATKKGDNYFAFARVGKHQIHQIKELNYDVLEGIPKILHRYKLRLNKHISIKNNYEFNALLFKQKSLSISNFTNPGIIFNTKFKKLNITNEIEAVLKHTYFVNEDNKKEQSYLVLNNTIIEHNNFFVNEYISGMINVKAGLVLKYGEVTNDISINQNFEALNKELDFYNLFDSSTLLGTQKVENISRLNYGVQFVGEHFSTRSNVTVSVSNFFVLNDKERKPNTSRFSPLIFETEIEKNNSLIKLNILTKFNKLNNLNLSFSINKKMIKANTYLYRLNNKKDQNWGIGGGIDLNLNRHFSLESAFDIDFDNKRFKYGCIGLKYESCCWNINIMWGSSLDLKKDTKKGYTYTNKFHLRLRLLGITNKQTLTMREKYAPNL